MHVREEIEEKLRKYFPEGRQPNTDSWRWGFRVGFMEGFGLAYDEIEKILKKLKEQRR